MSARKACRDKEKKHGFRTIEPSKYHKEIYQKSNPGRRMDHRMDYTTDIDMHCLKHTEYIANSKLYRNREKIMVSIEKMKPNETKLHQISGYREWKELSREYLANIPWISYSLVKDKNQTRNAVTDIIGRCNDYDDDHKDWVLYAHTKVPVMYIEIKKHDYNTLKKRMNYIKEELIAYVYDPDRISKMNDFDYLR
jgi:hypothetical protein